MLKQLIIKNFTLIDTLDIRFNPGFSVITGETGAGKSIILGAIGLLLGQRADTKAIKAGASKCVIEAHFDLSRYDMEEFFSQNDIEYDPDDCIVRRELAASGKSRAFINDTPAPLALLKELGERLIDVHSQHQNLLLGKQDFQLEVVDIIADDAAELYEADNMLAAEGAGAVGNLRSAGGAMEAVASMLPQAAELAERLNSTYIELKDVSQEISRLLESIDFDPAELDAINDRLDTIYSLEKKYHCESVEGLLARRNELREQIDNIDNSDEALAELQARVDAARQHCLDCGARLTALRTDAARRIEGEMQQRLVPLGMPSVRFSVAVDAEQPSRNGCDRVSFLFSANRSTPMQPVSQVASGGEIARVMLSLKAMISGAVKLPTIIFDEIDTGVSGKIAEKMALIMQQMGRSDRQVISITHLPQIAAVGQMHYKVYKEETDSGTTSRMILLDGDARVREIAQMLSGSDVSEAAINNAKELLRK